LQDLVMAVHQCPHCGEALSAQELEEGLCIGCTQPLPSGITARPPPPAGAVPPLTRRPDPSGWGLVRVGLSLLIWSLVLIMVAVLGLVVGQAVLGAGLGGDAVGPLFVLGLLGAGLVGGLLMLAGVCLCCTIPAQSGGRHWAVGLLVALVASVVLFLVQVVVVAAPRALAGRGPGAPVEVALAGDQVFRLLVLVWLVVLGGGSLCFFLLLRAIALSWGNRRLAEEVVAYFVVSWAVPIGVLVFGSRLQRAVDEHGLWWLFHGFMFLWLLTLYARLRDLIPSGGGPRRP
jgi:hypothetical protein